MTAIGCRCRVYGNPWGQHKVQGALSPADGPAESGAEYGVDIRARSSSGPLLRVWRACGRVLLWPLNRLSAARGQLFPWTVVFLACGISLWFWLPFEPRAEHYAVTAVVALICLPLWLRGPELAQPLVVAVLCVALGVLAAGVRAHMVAAPMLDFRYYGAVTGRVVEVDRSQSDALRVTLDQVVIERTSPERTPQRVRISLHGAEVQPPLPGQVVMTTAHLSAPQGPAEPGGFDFRRMAFFDGLGAVGYTRSPVVLWAEADPGGQMINRLRGWISRGMLAEMPGQAGAFATGAMTGDRSAITEATAQALRDSSLAHLLAISGMNMAFLVAFVFGLIRYGLALIPRVALRVNSKKVAALLSLAVGLFYLLLSGSNVATERAFLMVSVMLVAVLLDRRAMTMRSVAISGLILLIWQPETLMEPGFQMSFAATVALVAGFSAVDRQVVQARLPRWTMPVFTAVLSSALGGAATAPYAAAQFNRFADLGFIANLLTAPAMGTMIMPGGVMAALLWPFGLAAPALWVMEMGGAWILYVAYRTAEVEGAVTAIPSPPGWVIPVLSLGFAWLVLTHGRWRWMALAPALMAVGAWWDAGAQRPDLLISDDGSLVGLMGPEGRTLSAPRGAGFTASNWLENDGDLEGQEAAAARPGFDGPRQARSFTLAGWRGVVLSGKQAAGQLTEACAEYDLVITSARADQSGGFEQCRLIDAGVLRGTGAIAVRVQGESLLMTPVRSGGRIWMGRGATGRPQLLVRPDA